MIEELFNPANFELSIYAVLSSFAAIVLLLFSAYLLVQNKRSMANITFSIVAVTAAIWLSGTSFASIITDQGLALSLYKYYTFLGVALIAPSIYFLTVSTLELVGKKNFVIAYYVVALIFYTTGLSDDWMAIGMVEHSWGNYVQFSPHVYVFLVFFCVLLLQSSYHYYAYLKKNLPPNERDRVKLLFISFLIAYIGAVDFLPALGINMYPIGFIPILAFLAIQFYAILRYKFTITVNETFDNLDDGIITVDKNGKITNINASAKRMFETSNPHGRKINEAFPPLNEYLEGLKDPSYVINEDIPYKLMNPDVDEGTLHLTISPIRNDVSGDLGMVIVLSDITERMRSDIALQESEEKYRNLIERANEGVLIIQDNAIKFVNEKMIEISGFKRDELIGRGFLEVLPSKSKEGLIERYRYRLAGKEVPKQYEIDFLRNDGDSIVVEINAGIIEYKGRPADFVFLNDITERKKAEEEIKRSEEENRLLFENAVDPMLIVDERARLVRVNKKLEEILGYNREKYIGKNIFSIGLITPESIKITMKNLLKRARGDDIPPYEVELIAHDGSIKTFELNASRLEDGDKRVNSMVIMRDMTERKHTEELLNLSTEELKQSKKSAEAVLESTADAIFVIDFKGNILAANKASSDITGYKRDELIGNTFRLVAEKEEMKRAIKGMGTVLKEGVLRDYPLTLTRKDKKEIPVHFSGSLMRDEKGNPTHIIGVARDITEQKQAEEAIKVEREKYKNVVENIGDGLLVLDEQGSIIYSNPAAEKITGYTDGSLINKKMFNMVPKKNRMWMLLGLMAIAHGESFHNIEMGFMRKDGALRIIGLTITPHMEDSKLTRVMGVIRDITEQKMVEETIAIEKEKYKEVVENIEEGLFKIGTKGRVNFINPKVAEKMTGYAIDEIEGKLLTKLVPKDEAAMMVPNIQKLFNGETIRNLGTNILKKDGSTLPSLMSLTPKVKDGKVRELFGVLNDISEVKEAANALKREQERYKTVVENIGDGLFIVKTSGKMLYVNPEAERISGYSAEDIVGRPFTEILTEETQMIVLPGISKMVKGESLRDMETRFIRKDGTSIMISLTISPNMKDGKVTEIMGVMRDISEMKNAEEALKAEQERYKTVVENIGDGLFIVKTSGKMLYVNPEAEKISGYSAEDIVGRPFTEILTEETQMIVLPGISKMLKGESLRDVETHFIRKDGTSIMISLTISPSMKDGKVTELMGVMRDITEQKKADDQLLTHRARLQERTGQLEMANQMLSQSEDRYKMLIDNANDCIFHLDKSLRIVDINKRAIEMYGANKEEIIGKNALALGLMPKKGDVSGYMSILKDIIDGKIDNIDGIDAIIKNKRGEEVFLEANNSIARAGGIVTGMLVIARDVTDRKLMEEELKTKYDELIKREEELQALNEEMEAQNEELGGNYYKLLNMSEQLKMQQDVQKAFAGVISILNSTINLDVLLNRSLDSIAKFLSCQIGAIYLYDEKRDLLTPYATHGISAEFKDKEYKVGEGTVGQTAVLRSAQYIEEIPEDTNLVIKTIVGDIIPRTLMTYPIIYQDKLVGVIELGSASYTIGEDMMPYIDGIISQMGIAIKNSVAYENIQKLADELDIKNKEIQEANRLKSEFLANMSHELRTPMNSIIGFSNRVLKKSGHLLPERQFKNLEAVNRNAHNLLALINDILDLSKIEAGKMEVYYETFEIREIIGETVDAVTPIAMDKGLTIGKTVENVTVRSDKSKIKQILTNLLGNAIKFTKEGSIEVLSEDLKDGFVRMIIKDTGVGIKENDLEIIFDEFRQVDGSSTRKEGGTGLGLSITKRFVDIIGGSITAESEYGVGTSFIVTIPTNIEVQMKTEESTSAKEETVDFVTDEHLIETDNLTVLCIDDEKDVSELLNQYLSDEGYSVICADNGTEGVKIAKELHPDMITLDIMMPNVNGWEVISKLKQDPDTADIPVIVISILDDKNRAYRLGVKDYLLKPIEQDALVSSINKLYIEEIKNILLVEDDIDAVNLVTETLGYRDINIRVANNGFDGIKLLREFKPQLILLDLMMPGMDGFEFIEEMKNIKESVDIPIIVLTAKKLNKDEREYLDRHVSSVLEKSGSDMQDILNEISKTIRLEKKEQKKEVRKGMEVLL